MFPSYFIDTIQTIILAKEILYILYTNGLSDLKSSLKHYRNKSLCYVFLIQIFNMKPE